MAGKITDVSALTGANTASGDLFEIVDVSDTSLAATGTNKSITRDQLRVAVGVAPTQQILTVGSGTYTTPANCVAVIVQVIAAGGAGGGIAGSATQAGAGSGGASGGYALKLIAAPAATYAYVVGAKGTGSSAADGGAGADSTFGAGGGLITAKAGGGGFAGTLGTTAVANMMTRGGLSGGVATGGDINSEGQEGGVSFRQSATDAKAGPGASSVLGGGAPGPSGSAAGNAGTTKGAGGSGARTESVNTARAGGNGSDGLIIVTEFY